MLFRSLVFSTSAAIYGDNPVVPKVETMFPEPKSPYAVTKLDGEYYCGMFAREGWLPTACLRYFNVFGPRQDPKSQYAAAVPIFIDRALKNEPIRIFGDGEQTRDFIYVKDIVAANAFMATQSSAISRNSSCPLHCSRIQPPSRAPTALPKPASALAPK